MDDWQNALAALFLGYAFGSVPFGLLLTRMAGAGDLRAIGSGNIGATNVLRTGRKGIAAATLLLDLGKGLAAVIVARGVLPGPEFAALGAVLGHCFPLWLKFRGGKGVATTMGVTLALAWPLGVVFAAIWIATLLVTRFSSLAGIAAAAAMPLAALALDRADAAAVLTAIAAVVIFLHRGNARRLLDGSEPKIGSRK